MYGEEYPVKIVYDPEQLVTGFRSADYIPVVARAASNRTLGFTSLYRSAPHRGLYEIGLSLVLPDWRNTPIAGLMFRHSIKIAQTVPEPYEDFYRHVYGGFDDTRTLRVSADGLPSGSSTEMSTRVFDFAQLARVTVLEAGADFEKVFDAEQKRIADSHCTVIQVWLKSSCPWIGEAADILRTRGFFLGGILPRWFGEDGFLMQKVLTRPNWEGINLYTDRAAHILDYIRDDWERTVNHP